MHYGSNIIMGAWFYSAKERKSVKGTVTESSIFLGNKEVGEHAGSQWWCVLAGTDRGSVAMDPVIIIWPHIPTLSVQ